MPIDFPDNPTVNQEFLVDGRSWTWTGTTWDAVTQGASTAFEVSSTAPANPDEGSGWFDSATGQFFTYYDGAWVEFGTNLASTGPAGQDGQDGQAYGNIDGGKANSLYGGTTTLIQGGSAGSF